MQTIVPIIIEMTDEQVRAYAAKQGLARDGSGLYMRDVVADVRKHVLTSVQASTAFNDGAAQVAIRK